VAEIFVGYARCSTTSQDVRAQLSALKQLGVTDEHLHTDRGRTGRDLHDIAAELAGKGVKLRIGGSIHDPGDPIGKMFFGMLALMAEFESDLIRSRTVEGMREAAKRGRLLGKPSKLSWSQPVSASVQVDDDVLVEVGMGVGPVGFSAAQLMDISGLSRSAMYATLNKARQEHRGSREHR